MYLHLKNTCERRLNLMGMCSYMKHLKINGSTPHFQWVRPFKIDVSNAHNRSFCSIGRK